MRMPACRRRAEPGDSHDSAWNDSPTKDVFQCKRNVDGHASGRSVAVEAAARGEETHAEWRAALGNADGEWLQRRPHRVWGSARKNVRIIVSGALLCCLGAALTSHTDAFVLPGFAGVSGRQRAPLEHLQRVAPAGGAFLVALRGGCGVGEAEQAGGKEGPAENTEPVGENATAAKDEALPSSLINLSQRKRMTRAHSQVPCTNLRARPVQHHRGVLCPTTTARPPRASAELDRGAGAQVTFPPTDSFAFSVDSDLGFSLFLDRRCKRVYFIGNAEGVHNTVQQVRARARARARTARAALRRAPVTHACAQADLLIENGGDTYYDAQLSSKGPLPPARARAARPPCLTRGGARQDTTSASGCASRSCSTSTPSTSSSSSSPRSPAPSRPAPFPAPPPRRSCSVGG